MLSVDSTDRPLRTVAGVPTEHAGRVIDHLDDRLVSLIDLELTLKHVHWNVVGPDFLSVHEMLDDFVATVRPMVDATAERIRTLGGVPTGTPGFVASERTWPDYPLGVAPTSEHLRLLDDVFEHVLLDLRRSLVQVRELDPVTEDMLIEQVRTLEQHQWFIRSFLHGPQPDREAATFGVSDRAPAPEEEAAAERFAEISDSTREAYEEMTTTGASVHGAGRIV